MQDFIATSLCLTCLFVTGCGSTGDSSAGGDAAADLGLVADTVQPDSGPGDSGQTDVGGNADGAVDASEGDTMADYAMDLSVIPDIPWTTCLFTASGPGMSAGPC